MCTKSKAGVYKPKVFEAVNVPNFVQEAMADLEWKQAVLEKYQV